MRIETLRRAGVAALLCGVCAAPAAAQVYEGCVAQIEPGSLADPQNAYRLTTEDSQFTVVGRIETTREPILLLSPVEGIEPAQSLPAVIRADFFVDEEFDVEVFAVEIEAPITVALFEGDYVSVVWMAAQDNRPAFLRFYGDGEEFGSVELAAGVFDGTTHGVRLEGDDARQVHALLAGGGDFRVDLVIRGAVFSTLSVDGADYAGFFSRTVTPILDILVRDHLSGFC